MVWGDRMVSMQMFLQGLDSLRQQHHCRAGSIVQHYVTVDTSTRRLAYEAGFALECLQAVAARMNAVRLECVPGSPSFQLPAQHCLF